MTIYPFPQSYEKTSTQFAVTCGGEKVGVYLCDVSAFPLNQVWKGYQRPFEQTEPTSYVTLGSDGEFTLSIKPEKAFEKVIVRPLSKNITPVVSGDTVEITFPGAGQYSVEFDDTHHVLTVFANPEKEFDIDETDENTLYFAPGVHFMESVIALDDYQTVYIAPGAVVYGGFKASGKTGVRILGYGILDNSNLARGKGDPVSMSHCKNVHIEGFVVVNSCGWNMHIAACENVVVDNIKLIGMWRYNADGCDFTNCTNAVLKNSYLRNFDDCIVIKGLVHNTTLPVQNFYAEKCVLWCDWGRAIEIGAETCAPTMSNIRFYDCDIIHGDAVMMDIQHGDRADIYDVTFDNIRAEYTAFAQAGKLQTADDEVYVNPNPKHMPELFTVITVRTIYSNDDHTGNIKNIRFKNISVTTEDGRMPHSFIGATAKESSIADIFFENITLNGKKITSIDDMNLSVAASGGAVELPPSCIAKDMNTDYGTVKNIEII